MKRTVLNLDNKALEVSKLTKKYFYKFLNKKISALDEVTFSIEKGSMIAFLGPNGAGKSTLINILAGITNKSSGKAFINGFDLDKSINEAKLSIGVVPQELVMDPYFTPRETLNFQSGYYGIKKKNYLTEDLLKKLSLSDKSNSYVRFLSGGMKRRLMIAKAMVHSPPILILDEPTAGVDVELRQDMWKVVETLRKTGVTIILTTHYIEEAEAIADRVGVINQGEIIVVEETKELLKKMGHKKLTVDLQEEITEIPSSLDKYNLEIGKDKKSINYTYNVRAKSTGITNLLQDLKDANLKLQDLKTEQTTLEKIFVSLVKENNEI